MTLSTNKFYAHVSCNVAIHRRARFSVRPQVPNYPFKQKVVKIILVKWTIPIQRQIDLIDLVRLVLGSNFDPSNRTDNAKSHLTQNTSEKI